MGIEYLHIETYKGLVDKKLEKLGDVNILVGDNNTCKTTFLEAIKLVASEKQTNALFQILNDITLIKVKNDEISNTDEILENLMGLMNSNQNVEKTLKISSDNKKFYLSINELGYGLNKKEFDVSIMNSGGFSISLEEITYLSHLSLTEDENIKFLRTLDKMNTIKFNHLLSEVLLTNHDDIIKLLKDFDANIVGMTYVASEYTNKAILKIKHKNNGWLSVSNFGDGLRKIITIIYTILTIKNGGILLIDEIETSLHVSALEGVYSWLVKACKERDIQLFITTHSREALKTLVNQENANVVVYQLDNYENDILINHIDNETSKRILNKGGDLR